MAAVYLQRLWRRRFSLYLANMTLLPDLYSGSMSLPPADERYGKAGLHALTAAWTARSPYPFNRLASLNKVIDLFFAQLKLEGSTYYNGAEITHKFAAGQGSSDPGLFNRGSDDPLRATNRCL